MIRTFRIHLPVAALVLSLAACEEATVAPEVADVAIDHSDHSMHASMAARAGVPVRAHGDLFKQVRQQTARFNSTTQAARAGYAQVSHCVVHPTDPSAGAMGYHWMNGALVDPVFDPMQPEALLYAPGPGGNLRLVGVEYIVIDVGQPRPSFDGYEFDIGGVAPLEAEGVPHYTLHVWAHEENPVSPFAPFNPNVSCEYRR